MINQEMTTRQLFMEIAWSFLGKWYLWGGDDPSGLDCSGLVIECSKAAGIISPNSDTTANGLWKRWENYRIRGGKFGAMVFWSSEEDGPITHIEICLNDRFSIGARGDSTVVDLATAISKNAFIKVRPIYGRTGMILRGFADPLSVEESHERDVPVEG